MSMTHEDKQHQTNEFLDRLIARADRMREEKASVITAGEEGEPIIKTWLSNGMGVTVRPDDPQGILRISVGGGDKTPVPLNYCTVRGDIGQCIKLLKRAIRALESGG